VSHEVWLIRVEHMIDAIDRINDGLDGVDFKQFTQDHVIHGAVLWNFVIPGEAVRHIPDAIKQDRRHVDRRKVRLMQNFVAHVYGEIRLAIVWVTVNENLPKLRADLVALLEELGTSDAQ